MSLEIEMDTFRYAKHYLDKLQRLIKKGTFNKVEDEEHFICQCPIYNLLMN